MKNDFSFNKRITNMHVIQKLDQDFSIDPIVVFQHLKAIVHVLKIECSSR
jgi:hypothetical protein